MLPCPQVSSASQTQCRLSGSVANSLSLCPLPGEVFGDGEVEILGARVAIDALLKGDGCEGSSFFSATADPGQGKRRAQQQDGDSEAVRAKVRRSEGIQLAPMTLQEQP